MKRSVDQSHVTVLAPPYDWSQDHDFNSVADSTGQWVEHRSERDDQRD